MSNPSAAFNKLKDRLGTVVSLGQASALLEWDMQTQMPPGGGEARARHLSTLQKLRHEIFTSDETGKLLEAAEKETGSAAYESDEASLVRVARRDYNKDRKIPAALIGELGEATALAHEVWVKARANNDFKSFAPALQKILDLKRRVAGHVGYQDHIYDALLDDYEPGLKTSDVETLFAGLKTDLVPLIKTIASQEGAVSDAVLHQDFDPAKQRAFSEDVVKAFGFDFTRGRQDASVHPFCTNFSRNDVRITTRFDPKWLSPAMFGTFHEAGHAMYEQGVGQSLEGTPLAGGTSLGVHESQSRLWENVVGRSKAFWKFYFPKLQEVFPDQLGKTKLDDFFRAINKVSPSFIRVEADEASYHLHVLLRFEIERDLVADKVKVSELPKIWNDKFKEYLGTTPPSDTLGVLQDVHWSGGGIGYFPTYSMGTLLSAQLFDKAVEAHPKIPSEIERGEFGSLLGWLRKNVHEPGRKFEPKELIQKVVGEPLSSGAWLKYLKSKLGEIYKI